MHRQNRSNVSTSANGGVISSQIITDLTKVEIFGEIVDVTKWPKQVLTPQQVVDVSTPEKAKAAIRNDFTSKGVYVTDDYVNAVYACVSDINFPGGQIPPNMGLPTPPAWWAGYRPER